MELEHERESGDVESPFNLYSRFTIDDLRIFYIPSLVSLFAVLILWRFSPDRLSSL